MAEGPIVHSCLATRPNGTAYLYARYLHPADSCPKCGHERPAEASA